MDHLQTFNVAFVGSVARVFNGTTYYRNCFYINKKLYGAKAAIDYKGKAGVVQFLKKDADFNGVKIAQDCFTIVMETNQSSVASANATLTELTSALA